MIESINVFFVLAFKILSSQLTTERLLIRCLVSTGGSAQSKVGSELAMEVGQPESG